MTSPFVSAEWLYAHLEDPQVAIADCRFALMQPELGQHQYQESHIPGAFYLDLNQDLSGPVGRHGGRHPLPDPATLATKLTAMGIVSAASAPTLVVAYDDSRFAFASRLWWLLRYLGHVQVAVLDGGWTGWQKVGYPVTAVVPEPRSGKFKPQLQAEMVLDREQVILQKDLPEVVLVDAREADRYQGEREPIDPIAGHIPGAVNYPWQEVTTADGFGRSPDAQRQRWEKLQSAEEIIIYCGSGITACVNLLSLEAAGLSTGKLYAGSWSDWCSYLIPES